MLQRVVRRIVLLTYASALLRTTVRMVIRPRIDDDVDGHADEIAGWFTLWDRA